MTNICIKHPYDMFLGKVPLHFYTLILYFVKPEGELDNLKVHFYS